MIVILARQQLFTENTITPILPLMAEKTAQNIMCVIRLWLVVFAANMVGTLIFAAFCTFTAAMNDTVYTAMLELSRHMMQNGWWEMLVRGIVSGWLMAALVWLIPSTKGSEFLVITLMTYLIAAGDFTHVVAGSVEAFLLVLNGELNLSAMIWQFIVPVFIGNVIGGNIAVP